MNTKRTLIGISIIIGIVSFLAVSDVGEIFITTNAQNMSNTRKPQEKPGIIDYLSYSYKVSRDYYNLYFMSPFKKIWENVDEAYMNRVKHILSRVYVKEADKLEETMNQFQNMLEIHGSIKTTLEEISQESKELRKEFESLQKEIHDYPNQIFNINDEIRDFREVKRKLKEITKKLDEMQTTLDETKEQTRQNSNRIRSLQWDVNMLDLDLDLDY